jgi:protease IV
MPRSDRHKPILLELDLTQPLVEQEPSDPVAKFRTRGKPRLRAIIRTLHEAGADARVAGLIAKVGGKQLTLSTAQELRDAVTAFAASGKPTVAWTDTYGESSNGTTAYFLASGFSEVWLQPTGELNLLGVASEVQFLRGVLDKLGVDPQLGRRYEYKNAADRIIQSEFTPAHREASDRLAASAWEQVVDAITTARGLTADELQAAVDTSPLFSDEAQQARLVDRLGYRDEVYTDVRRRLGGDVRLLFADKWTPDRKPVARIVHQAKQKSAPGIALVDGAGGIVTGRSRRTPLQGPMMGSDTICAAFRAAVRDDKVRAIVFRVDSPGGSAVASDSIWREVKCARTAGKPVIVSMGSMAGSGGYYVSCSADVIVATPSTLTGSIGVVGGKAVTTGLTDRIGLSYGAVHRGAHALMHSTHQSFSDSEKARLEAWLDRIYTDFTGAVAESRGMTREAVHEVAKGRVWTGADAQKHGLIDELGGLRTAVAIARERAGLPPGAPLRPAVQVPAVAKVRPPMSSDDPRAASIAMGTWAAGWGSFAELARVADWPMYGPLTMPLIRLR